MKQAKPLSLLRLVQDLIAIPSVNPTGDPGTSGINEQHVANYIAQFLQTAGAEVSLQTIEPNRPNVVGIWKSQGKRRCRILLAPHTDTVSVLGMTISPFDPAVKEGKLFGRGSTDTKGPMGAMLWALQEWARNSPQKGVELTFVGLMGEEAGNDGAIAFAKKKTPYDLVVVGEPTELQVVTAHKGATWFELESRGKACHASIPEHGSNAIYPMAQAVRNIERHVLPKLRTFRHPTLGAPTMSIGTIRGGSKVNIVPDHCLVEVDCRTVPDFAEQEVLALLRERLPAEVAVRVQRSAPPLDTNPDNPWIQRLQQAARGTTVAPWFCDAAVFGRSGLPAVAFGPGSIAQAHTKDEFIAVADLEAGARAYLQFLRSL